MPDGAIGNCEQLLQTFQNAVQGTSPNQTLQLDAALLPAAGGLIGYLGLQSLLIHQLPSGEELVSSGQPESCVLIQGTAVLFPKGTETYEYAVTIRASLNAANEATMELDGKPADTATWNFGKNFTGLSKYNGFDEESQSLKLLPSFYDTLSIERPDFRAATRGIAGTPAGLSFTGSADMNAGVLSSIAPYFPGVEELALSGAIDMNAPDFPAIALSGPLTGYLVPGLDTFSLCFGTKPAQTTPDEQPALSTLLLAATTTGSLAGFDVTCPVLEGSFAWAITVSLSAEESKQYPLDKMLSGMTSYANSSALPLPQGMGTTGFLLESITVVINPSSPGILQSVGFRVISVPGKSWTAPIFGLTVTNLFTQWQFLYPPGGTAYLSGGVGGQLLFGTATDAPRLDISISLDGITTASAPDVSIRAELDPDYPVPLDKLFYQLTGLPIDLDLEITELLFVAETGPRVLQFATTLDGEWPFKVPLLTFGTTNFLFQYSPNSISGTASVVVSIANFRFLVSAQYGTGEGWTFSGALAADSQNNSLQDFVNSMTDRYPELPANLGAINLTRLDISFNTSTQAFSFDGVLEWPFKFDDWDISIEAELSLNSPGPKNSQPRQYNGFVRGTLTINAFRFDVIYSFDIEKNTNISFVFAYKGATLTFAYKNDGKQKTLTANLTGVSFGDILAYLINLADPASNYTLPSPWNVLYQISFDNLTFTANLTKNTVGVFYKISVNLGIIDLKSIGLTYLSRAGKGTVEIAMTGRFFDQTYTEEQPLGWDLLNDQPPSAPGTGEQLLDLRYVGIGQNVGFRSAQSFTNVQSVLAEMVKDFPTLDKEDENPLSSPLLQQLQFAGDGRWLIGADFTLMEAVSLTVVFNDPTLYGLRVALAGDKVKSFSGLDFQILYKRVTDTIGVYHIELTLPQAFRQLNFGAVAITIPIVVVDIYTNGNFRVDMGFPVGTDFSRSFCLQAGPFIGYGGIYFALLDGSTSDRVPRITNGTFSPVIEAGLALSMGLGRTIDKGIFKAGATITVIGILEGVFGWFNPNDNSAPSAQYYWIQGTIAIAGKLEGSVDFVVISASVSLSLVAKLVMTFEAYKAVDVKCSFQVTASASIKILFIRISFSFSMTIEIGFSIGSSSQAPWILDTTQPQPLLMSQRMPLRQRRLSAGMLRRALVAVLGDDAGSFDWQPRKVFDALQLLPLQMMPALTPVSVMNFPATLQTALALYVPTTVPDGAMGAEAIRAVTLAEAESNPFNRLCAGMLLWALSSYTRNSLLGDSTEVYSTDLDAIAAFLGDFTKWPQVFTYDTLNQLLGLNFLAQISSPMTPQGIVHPQLGLLAADSATGTESYTVFPMPPSLNVTYDEIKQVFYDSYNQVTTQWEEALAIYNAQMKATSSGSDMADAIADWPAGTESLATFLFRDYFAMVTRAAVQSAQDLMQSYPYAVTGPTGGSPESLASIAEQFNTTSVVYRSRRGETLGRIAARFGMHSSELHVNNAHLLAFTTGDELPEGTEVEVAASVTPVSIAGNNSDYPLNGATGPISVSMPIDGVMHQVQAGASGPGSQSINDVARRYGIPDAAEIFTFQGENNPNAINPQLLQPGSTLVIPQLSLQNFASRELAAAFIFARSLGTFSTQATPFYGNVNWYQQWILTNNSDLGSSPWAVPRVKVVDGSLVSDGQTAYAPMGSPFTPDTPALAAAYQVLMQINPEPYAGAFTAFLNGVTPSGSNFTVPSFPYTVQAGDTLQGIAETFGITVAQLVNNNLYALGLLQLLAVMPLPAIDYVPQLGDTLSSVAASFDLPLDTLVLSVQDAPGILQPYRYSQSQLLIPDVPARATDLLVSDLVRYGSFNNVSGMVANFLMHGMRVPQPTARIDGRTFPPDTDLYSLFELAGQQFEVPRGPSGPEGCDAIFRQTVKEPWVEFMGPGPSGTSGPTAVPELLLSLRGDYLANPPGITLDPQLLAGPAALPLYRETPPQYAFLQNIGWQSAQVLAYPGPTGASDTTPSAGQPTILVIPPVLQDIAIAGATGPWSATPPYEVVTQNSSGSSTAPITPVDRFMWAMAVDVRVRQTPAGSGDGPMPNTYMVVGADQDGRQDLLRAWQYLDTTFPPHGDLYLLFRPGSTSANSMGLASTPLNPQATFVLKSNLTTVTTSNQGGAFAAALGQSLPLQYSATLDDAPGFVRLLWEASVTGSGGFFLNYASANGGGGLPADLFSDSDTTTLTLLYVPYEQSRYPHTLRGLYPFNNCVVIGDSIDPNNTTLFAQLADPTPGDLQRIGTAPAGNIGFYMARVNPDDGATGNYVPPDQQTESLFNLVGFQVLGSTGINMSNHGLPIGSSDTPAPGVSGPTGSDVWWYQQIVPIAQFGQDNQTPQCQALPAPASNPYAGISGPTGITGPASLNSAVIDIAFNDVYGNHTHTTVPVGPISIPVGYTDEILNLSTWPGIGADFTFAPAGATANVVLETSLSLQINRYLPADSYTYEQSHRVAVADAARYAQLYYQVQQHDLNFSLDTNIGSPLIGPESLKAPLQAFVTKANVFVRAAETLKQHIYSTVAQDTLGAIATTFGVTPGMLADANLDTQVKSLFAGSMVRPAITAAAPMNSLNAMVVNEISKPYPPVCPETIEAASQSSGSSWVAGLRVGSPSQKLAVAADKKRMLNISGLTVGELAKNNLTAPLTPGNLLRISANKTNEPLGPDNSLETIAAAFNCAIYAQFPDAATKTTVYVGLYVENLTTTGIVRPNIDITIDGLTQNTGAAPTLATVEKSFAPLGLDTGSFVLKLQSVTGLFLDAAVLSYATFFVPQPARTPTTTAPPTFSLAQVPPAAGTPATLAELNAAVTNFYVTGTPIYLNYTCYAPAQFDTFRSLAAEFGLTTTQLAAFNTTTLCNQGIELAIPNLVILPDDVAQYAPFTPLVNDSLTDIADLFGGGPEMVSSIAILNQYLPGIFSETAVIPPGYTPPPMASLDDTAAALGQPFPYFIQQIATRTELFRANGVILVPAPTVLGGDGSSLSWNGLAGQFRLHEADGDAPATVLLNANRCLEGFLREGQSIAGPPGSTPLKVGPYDTVDTLIRRFAATQGLTVTVAELVETNGNTNGLLTAGKLFLLPPNPTPVPCDVRVKVPPAPREGVSQCESQIAFPITVAIGMTRNHLLVAPDFAQTAPVFRAASPVAPRGWANASETTDATSFAVQFEAAFASWKLKCAFSQESAGTGSERRVLWAVNFGATGVSRVAIETALPTFWALKPLSTQLIGGDLWVQPYRSGCGLCTSVLKRFESVDLDNWMQQFLATLDLVLTSPYAVPAYEQIPSGAGGQFMSVPPEPPAAPEGPASFRQIVALGIGAGASLDVPGFGATGGGCTGCTGPTGIFGPLNYEGLVNAKLTLAEQLSVSAEPILQGVGATGTYYADVAQETFYQQMLVELSTAYKVNAVVQYPVDVISPCVLPYPGASGPLPPRLSGNITPALPVVPQAGTLLSANPSPVSAAFFARALGKVQGILLTGAQATYGGKTETVLFNDTLESLASRFGANIAPDNWDPWSAFIAGIQAQVLLTAGASLPAVTMVRTTGANTTIGDIASFFGVDSGTTGQANQALPNILPTGTVLDLPGEQQYTLKDGDTLQKIAAALNPPISVALLSEELASKQVALSANCTLAYAQPLPDVNFSTTKVNLGRVGSTSGDAPALSFLFSVKHPRQFQSLFLNLQYAANEIEYNVSNVEGTEGYQDSSWLTFLLPFGPNAAQDFGVSTAMEQVQVPIPLRSYPTPPSLLAQSSLPSEQTDAAPTPDEEVARGKQWDYAFDIQSNNAAQDTDHVQVTFNALQAGQQNVASIDAKTWRIFAALAQFIEAFPSLMADLALLPALAPGTYNQQAAMALAVFDRLANNVANSMKPTFELDAIGNEWPSLLYQYRAQAKSDGESLETLQLTQELGPTGIPGPLWPEIFVASPSGPTEGRNAGFEQLDWISSTGDVAFYRYPKGVPAGARLTQRYTFEQRDVIQNMNAWGGVFLTRNDDLVASGPVGWNGGATGPVFPIATNPAFLYETPLVRFVDPSTPQLTDNTVIDVAGLTGPYKSPRPLSVQIEAMLDAVLEWGPASPVQATSWLSILCNYGYRVSQSSGAEEIVATVPVRLVPTRQLEGAQKAGFAEALAQSILEWPGWSTTRPDSFVEFDMKVFTVPPGASAQISSLRPVLEFSSLRLPVDSISSQAQ